MRRTFVLFGVAVLATVGLAGPAHASKINAQTDIFIAQVVADTFGSSTESWIELRTASGIDGSLEGLSLVGCVGANSNPTVFVYEFPPGAFVPANGSYIIADPFTTSVTPDATWDLSASGELDDDSFLIMLVLDLHTTPFVIDSVSQDPDSELVGGCLNQLPG